MRRLQRLTSVTLVLALFIASGFIDGCASRGTGKNNTIMNASNALLAASTVVKTIQSTVTAEVAAGVLKPDQAAKATKAVDEALAAIGAAQAAVAAYASVANGLNASAAGVQIQATLAALSSLSTSLASLGVLKGSTATDVQLAIVGLNVLVAELRAAGVLK